MEYDATYDDVHDARVKMMEIVKDFDEGQVHVLPNMGNNPSFRYILRDMDWKGEA